MIFLQYEIFDEIVAIKIVLFYKDFYTCYDLSSFIYIIFATRDYEILQFIAARCAGLRMVKTE